MFYDNGLSDGFVIDCYVSSLSDGILFHVSLAHYISSQLHS